MKFLAPVLAILNRIYRFAGGLVQTDSVDLEGKIQLVHNVSREAELGSTFVDMRVGGLFQVDQDIVHPGAGGLSADVDPYAALATMLGVSAASVADRFWIWLVNASVTATVQVIDATHAATLSLEVAQVGAALADRDYFVARWNAMGTMAITGGTGLGAFSASTDNVGNVCTAPLYFMAMPLLVPVGGKLGFSSSASAAATVTLQTLCWHGPIGVYPPGMA